MYHWLSSVTPISRLLGWTAVPLLLYQIGAWMWIGWWAPPGWSLRRYFAGPTHPGWWHWVNLATFVMAIATWSLAQYWRTSFPGGGLE